jgi:phospholipid/cholesterol/gamma-HCH transport system permease protein
MRKTAFTFLINPILGTTKNVIQKTKIWLIFFYKTIIDIRPAFLYRGETFKQIYILGNQALPLVIFAVMFVSMVLTLEWAKKLEPFGAKLMLGRIVSISVIREIGPMVSGLMLAGRSGAKIVSEIGNMVLSQQVDALRAFGTDPIKRLIVPRVFASFVIMAPLTIIADTMGIIAGWFTAVVFSGVDSQFFWISVKGGLLLKDLIIGIINWDYQ